jgi:clan AA aspartic protease (TIGR02281 family)
MSGHLPNRRARRALRRASLVLGVVAASGLVVGATASPASAQLWPAVAISIGWPEILAAGVVYCIATDCLGSNRAQAGAGNGGIVRGSDLTIPVGSYNQCETDISANNHTFHALLDSGANGHLTFGRNHAKALGFNPDSLSYSYTYGSANGTGHLAKVTLREVRIGNWSLRDVPAEITQAEQSEVLVGLEILHPLNFRLSGGACHLQLPQAAVKASVHPSPSALPRQDNQPASAPRVSRIEPEPPPAGSPLAMANDQQKTGFCLYVMQRRQFAAAEWCADYLASRSR